MELLSKCISEEANKERWTAKGRIAKRRIPKENIVLNVKEDGVFTRNMAVGQLVVVTDCCIRSSPRQRSENAKNKPECMAIDDDVHHHCNLQAIQQSTGGAIIIMLTALYSSEYGKFFSFEYQSYYFLARTPTHTLTHALQG